VEQLSLIELEPGEIQRLREIALGNDGTQNIVEQSHGTPRSIRPSTRDRVIDDQHDDCPDYRDDQAVDVEAGDAAGANRDKDEAADQRPDEAEDDVEKEAFALFVHDLPCDEARDEPSAILPMMDMCSPGVA
jgi:hypothetical protein